MQSAQRLQTRSEAERRVAAAAAAAEAERETLKKQHAEVRELPGAHFVGCCFVHENPTPGAASYHNACFLESITNLVLALPCFRL